MNILHTEASHGWGGQEMRILREALGMKKRGHFIFFAIQKDGVLVQKLRQLGFTVYEIDFRKRKWPIAFFKIRSILKKEKIDLINTHSSLDSWITSIVAKMLNIHVVRTRHLSTKVRKGFNSYILYNFLTDFVITTCEKVVPILSEQSKKPLSLIRSIPTGIEAEEIHTSLDKQMQFRKDLKVKDTDLLVGMVCFMRSWKGIEDFFKAASLLQNKPDIKWIMIGGGHSQTYIEKAKEMKLTQVLFSGHLNVPYDAIAALDIFVLLSTANEGVSQASLQAAYLKKPLVTTPVGGLCEVCIDQETGFIVPPFSPEKVAEAILKLKENPLLRGIFGDNAKNLVLKKFTFQKTLDEVDQVYTQVAHVPRKKKHVAI